MGRLKKFSDCIAKFCKETGKPGPCADPNSKRQQRAKKLEGRVEGLMNKLNNARVAVKEHEAGKRQASHEFEKRRSWGADAGHEYRWMRDHDQKAQASRKAVKSLLAKIRKIAPKQKIPTATWETEMSGKYTKYDK